MLGNADLPGMINAQGHSSGNKICASERTCRLKPLLPSCNHGFLVIARSLLKAGTVRQVWQILCMGGNADRNLRERNVRELGRR